MTSPRRLPIGLNCIQANFASQLISPLRCAFLFMTAAPRRTWTVLVPLPPLRKNPTLMTLQSLQSTLRQHLTPTTLPFILLSFTKTRIPMTLQTMSLNPPTKLLPPSMNAEQAFTSPNATLPTTTSHDPSAMVPPSTDPLTSDTVPRNELQQRSSPWHDLPPPLLQTLELPPVVPSTPYLTSKIHALAHHNFDTITEEPDSPSPTTVPTVFEPAQLDRIQYSIRLGPQTIDTVLPTPSSELHTSPKRSSQPIPLEPTIIIRPPPSFLPSSTSTTPLPQRSPRTGRTISYPVVKELPPLEPSDSWSSNACPTLSVIQAPPTHKYNTRASARASSVPPATTDQTVQLPTKHTIAPSQSRFLLSRHPWLRPLRSLLLLRFPLHRLAITCLQCQRMNFLLTCAMHIHFRLLTCQRCNVNVLILVH